jgi:hypothetical protein
MTSNLKKDENPVEIPEMIVDPSPRSNVRFERGRFLGKVSV